MVSVPLVNFHQDGATLHDGTKVAGYITNMVFKPSYINENIGFQDGENSTFWDSLSGLQDVTLAETTGSAVPVVKVTATTGAAIIITSVVISGTVATVNIDNTDLNYPTSGGSIKLSLAAASVLYAAGVEYFESNTLTIAIP